MIDAVRRAADRMPGTEIYWDPAIYQREMDEIFGRAWLFVGHDTMLPRPGDFVSAYMGNDPVVVVRDRSNELHVYLNRCRHRGNKVCLYDSGSAKSFRCAYHGWTYGLEGDLAAVPLLDKAYDPDFPRDQLGLVAAPRVATYHGLIFASWAESGPTLENFLGDDLRWYLDTFAFDDPAGLEVLPGRHRYMVPCNWKMLSENFGGDMYHFGITHASVVMIARQGKAPSRTAVSTDDYYSVKCNGDRGEAHGILQLSFGEGTYERDLEKAAALSPAAVAWVKERRARREKLLGDLRSRPTGIHTGNIWPNLSFNGFGSTAIYARTLLVWQPRGPEETDVWQWGFVERSAPPEVKEAMVVNLTQGQSAAGMVAPDDVDNFLRMRDVLHTARAGKVAFNYDLGGKEHESLIPELPGCVMEQMTERYHRAFYRYWDSIMGDAG